jgi:gliding motility-associated lipoprotein GldH
LRIRSNYTYSNIWLLYELEGPGLQQQNQFEITLSDQTGRWMGQGKSNLITFQQPFLDQIPFKAGTYTLRIKQNMRDEQLAGVSDVGFQLVRGRPIL